MKREDLVPKEQVGKEFSGESYLVRWGEAHRWFFLGGMGRDEVCVMRIWDSWETRGEGVDCEFILFRFCCFLEGGGERARDGADEDRSCAF